MGDKEEKTAYVSQSYTFSYNLTDVYTAALFLRKLSSDDDSEFRNGIGAEASLPLLQSPPVVIHNITRLCWIDVTLCSGCRLKGSL